MEKDITELEGLLDELNTELGPWMQEINENMEKHGHKAFSKSFTSKGAVAKSQISASFAFILQTLYFWLLKVNNVDTEEHGINDEIDRIRKLYIKIDKVLNPEKYEAKPKSNTAVTKRIVSSVLSANNFINKQHAMEKESAKQKAKSKSKGKHKVDSAAFMDAESD